MDFRKRWKKELSKMLTDTEKEAFSLWQEFSNGKISETEFKSKMDLKIMPKLLGKLSAARMNALEDEVERLRKRVASLEDRVNKKP